MGVDVMIVDYDLHPKSILSDPCNFAIEFLIYQEFAPTHYLKYVDEYGRTIFNDRQMEPLIQELDLLLANTALSDSARTFIVGVRALAVRCQQHDGILMFNGD